MKKKLVYIFAFVAGLGFTACEDTLDTEDLSTDNLEYLCSNPTDARKMIDHVYSYFCEDTYTSRMSTNWMQNTDVEIGWIDQENAEKGDRRSVWGINMIEFSDIQNCWDNTLKAIDFANQCIQGIEASDMYKSGDELIQFRADGSMVTVSAYILTDAWAQITGDTEEVEIEYDTWRISDDKIISGNGETVKFKLKGNKLTLTPTSGIIIPLTFTRVSDSRINRYLN